MNIFAIIAVFFILCVALSLLVGLSKMVKQEDAARHKSQNWMRIRVALQLLAVVFLLLSFLFPDVRL